MLLTHALELSADHFLCSKKSRRVRMCTSLQKIRCQDKTCEVAVKSPDEYVCALAYKKFVVRTKLAKFCASSFVLHSSQKCYCSKLRSFRNCIDGDRFSFLLFKNILCSERTASYFVRIITLFGRYFVCVRTLHIQL